MILINVPNDYSFSKGRLLVNGFGLIDYSKVEIIGTALYIESESVMTVLGLPLISNTFPPFNYLK